MTKRQAMKKLNIGKDKLDSLEFLVDVFNNEANDLSYRIRAAEAVLPYMHSKMPTNVNLAVELPQSVMIDSPLSRRNAGTIATN